MQESKSAGKDDNMLPEWIPDPEHVLCGGVMSQKKIDKACKMFLLAMNILP